ncbi:MAG: flagellar biosynthetic protein FliO [Candidatus Cybelea sp.]
MPANFWASYVAKLAIVALGVAVLYLLARKLRQARFLGDIGRCVRLVESTALSQHAALHVVRVGRRYFLIGSSTGVDLLAELRPSDVPEDASIR